LSPSLAVILPRAAPSFCRFHGRRLVDSPYREITFASSTSTPSSPWPPGPWTSLKLCPPSVNAALHYNAVTEAAQCVDLVSPTSPATPPTKTDADRKKRRKNVVSFNRAPSPFPKHQASTPLLLQDLVYLRGNWTVYPQASMGTKDTYSAEPTWITRERSPKTIKRNPPPRPSAFWQTPRFPPLPQSKVLAEIKDIENTDKQCKDVVVFSRGPPSRDVGDLPTGQSLIRRYPGMLVLQIDRQMKQIVLPFNKYTRQHPIEIPEHPRISWKSLAERLQIAEEPFPQPPATERPIRPRYLTLNPAAYLLSPRPKAPVSINFDISHPPSRHIKYLFGPPIQKRTTPLIFEPRRPSKVFSTPEKRN